MPIAAGQPVAAVAVNGAVAVVIAALVATVTDDQEETAVAVPGGMINRCVRIVYYNRVMLDPVFFVC